MKRLTFALLPAALLLASCGGGTAATAVPSATPPIPSIETGLPSDTPVPTLAATPTLGVGSSRVAAQDGMVQLYVPAGPFPMGSESGYSDEQPVHTVDLPAFWIDQTEVTNGMYALCEQAGVCAPPMRQSSNVIDFYYGFEGYNAYPVIFVSWQDAVDYCTWVGRRLPTEAEWEKAARGPDGRSYPWGEALPDPTLANFDRQTADVMAVGSFPAGASPYGALDMAGNVLEWTADRYGRDYYTASPASNPLGPETGDRRVVRGGAWTSNAGGVRASYRYVHDPEAPSFELGFRCASGDQP